ncbi:serine--tRNA ligase [bacterium]|nr:serine--tRNA ligase [bacterium]HPF35812.1 serine--tRNA ligase [Candidatus Krumholzibacteria bacterium]HRX51565.1 serine--tRNA ligase [Candidatus Krumholzibacteria bacterium]
MLDRKFLRENRELVENSVRAKRESVDIEAYYAQDERRRAALQETETLQAEANRANKAIAEARKAGEDTSDAIARMKEVSARIKDLKADADACEQAVDALYMRIPNIPLPQVPVGGEEDNQVVRSWGEPRSFDFEVQPHWDAATRLGIMDLEAAARMSGSGFTLLTGAGARLERALINFMLDVHLEQGYREVNVPYLCTPETMTGTGQLPKMAEDMYHCGVDDLYLIPTAEVTVTNIHRKSTLEAERLPVKYVAFSPCFRREAGAAGKDTRGLLRVHQFHKVEMVQFTHPDASAAALDSLTDDAEEILRRLDLPYRVLRLATGDLSFAAAMCYDLEAWAPGVGSWLEVSSCSTFTDFQARRAGIRYRGGDDSGYVHTLNGSGLALPRVLVAIMENYQNADGTITVPEVLRPYMGGLEIIG